METIIRDERQPLEFKTIVGKLSIFSYVGSHFAPTHSKFVIPCSSQYHERDAEWNKTHKESEWKKSNMGNAVNLDERTYVGIATIAAIEYRDSTQEEIAEYYQTLAENNLAFREYSQLTTPSIFTHKRVKWLRRDVFIKDKSKLRFRVWGGEKVYTLDNLKDAASELKAGQAFVWFADNGYSYMGTTPSNIDKVVEYVEKLTQGTTEFVDGARSAFIPRLSHFNDGYFAKGKDGVITLRVGKNEHWSEVSNT